MTGPFTYSPDPVHLGSGAGDAVSQASRPQLYADADGTGWTNTPAVPATGATSGAPGTFTPNNAIPPDNFAGMAGLTATPAIVWVTGNYVQPKDGSNAFWNGTAWAVGKAP
jgi:hypothetical protein